MADTIDSYIKGFPAKTQKALKQIRSAIRKLAGESEEKMSYGVPTYWWHGNLVHFGGYERHIGFYPGPSAIAAFKDELKEYKSAKGSVQFPIDKPLPMALIRKMVQFRIDEQRPYPKIGRPAQSALDQANIKDLKVLSKWKESDVAALHGMGPKAMQILKEAMKKKKLSFAKA